MKVCSTERIKKLLKLS